MCGPSSNHLVAKLEETYECLFRGLQTFQISHVLSKDSLFVGICQFPRSTILHPPCVSFLVTQSFAIAEKARMGL
jgi:hypothetical protein